MSASTARHSIARLLLAVLCMLACPPLVFLTLRFLVAQFEPASGAGTSLPGGTDPSSCLAEEGGEAVEDGGGDDDLVSATAVDWAERSLSWLRGENSIVERYPGGNLGHRGGHDCVAILPENSLQSLRATATFQETFRYLEFDVRETSDRHVVLFHDSTLKRVLPPNGANQAAAKRLGKRHRKPYARLTVADVTLADIQSLWLNGIPGWRVPTLNEFLAECRSLPLTAPVALEVKELRSNVAREALLSAAADYKGWHASVARPRRSGDGWNFLRYGRDTGDRLVLLGFRGSAYASFPGEWGARMRERGLRMFRTRNHGQEFFVPVSTDGVSSNLVGDWITVSGSKYFTGEGVLTIRPSKDCPGQLEFLGHGYGTLDSGVVHIRTTATSVNGVVRPEINLKARGARTNDHIFTLVSDNEMSGWCVQNKGTWTLRKQKGERVRTSRPATADPTATPLTGVGP